MRTGPLFCLIAQRALACGRPLDLELQSLAAALGGLGSGSAHSVQRAVDFAREGKLRQALKALRPLGFDPLLADAAALRPEATSEVATALQGLPGPTQALWRVAAPLGYLLVVVILEAQVAALLSWKVLPVLGQTGPSMLPLLGFAGWTATGLVVLSAAVALWAGLSGSGRRWLLGPLSSARLCAAFAPLAASGVPAQEAFELSRTHGPRLARDFSKLPAASLEWRELAAHFSEQGLARLERLSLWVKLTGTGLAVLLALLIAASVYLTLPMLTAAGVQ